MVYEKNVLRYWTDLKTAVHEGYPVIVAAKVFSLPNASILYRETKSSRLTEFIISRARDIIGKHSL